MNLSDRRHVKAPLWGEPSMFTQILNPTGNLFVTWLVALVPVLLLLFLLAGLRMSAWLAVLIGSIVTFFLGLWVWQMPLGDGVLAYLYGSATGVWNVDWITFWGVMLFNTLVTTGSFDRLRRWLVQQGTRDVRVQTILFAWAFGALLEGLVGFGYPWASLISTLSASRRSRTMRRFRTARSARRSLRSQQSQPARSA
jgi:lactate permease